MSCRHHKAPPDFYVELGGKRFWKCSSCGKRGQWRGGWGYYGSLGCKHCGWPKVDWVACSDACARMMANSKETK